MTAAENVTTTDESDKVVKDEEKSEKSTKEEENSMKEEEKKPVDESTTESDEIDAKTIEGMASRLRFYFSNANLRSDRFLRREVTESKDGLVPIDTLLRFNTIKAVSPKPQALVRAVQEDETLKTKLKLNEDKTSIARIKPFTMDMMKDNVVVTLRVSNIPVKGERGKEEYTVNREEIEEAFKEFGYVSMVRMLYNYNQDGRNGGKSRSRAAIGRAFVEMETVEEMQAAVAVLCPTESVEKETEKNTEEKSDKVEEKPKKILKFGGVEVRVKTMQQWLDQREAKRISRFGERGGDRVDGKRDTRGGEVRNSKGADKRARENNSGETVEKIEFKLDWKKGCVISVKGLADGTDREKILDAVQGVAGNDVRVRADYSRGQKDGAIRFEAPNEKITELTSKLNDGTVLIGGVKVESASIIEGEAEEKYYKNFISFRTKQMQTKADEKNQRKRFRR